MTTPVDAFEAGFEAIEADNGLNKGGFADAMRTVLATRFSDGEAKDLVDAVAAEYERLGIINNPTYSSFRGKIISEGVAACVALFTALGASLNGLPEMVPAIESAELIDLREDRDQVNDALDRCDVLIAAEPSGTVGRLVKDVLRQGKGALREYKERVRTGIQGITGDPDS